MLTHKTNLIEIRNTEIAEKMNTSAAKRQLLMFVPQKSRGKIRIFSKDI